MKQNNYQRMRIALSCNNIYDYDEFKNKCEEQSCTPMLIGEWAQKIGVLQAALFKFPDKTPEEAYEALFDIINIMPANTLIITQDTKQIKPCGSCGGGKVL